MLILGGYGNAGLQIARLLLQHTDVQVVLAGRSLPKARAKAEALEQEFGLDWVGAAQADAANPQSLSTAFRGIRLVVVASSTIPHTANIVRAALEAGADYLDIQLSDPAKLGVLRSLQNEIEQEGRTFITDGGFHPGLPAALVRYAAGKLERLERAVVSSVIQEDWGSLELSASSVDELVGALGYFRPLAFKGGTWKTAGWADYPRFDFGPPFGRRACSPMFMEELNDLPGFFPYLRETGFYVGGFNPVCDYLAMPLLMLALKIGSSRLSGLAKDFFVWSLRAFSRPPFGTGLILEASGWQGPEPAQLRLRLSHPDGYFLTAAPVVATLIQYLQRQIPAGLWLQAHAVEPERLLRDIGRLGVQLEVDLAQHLPQEKSFDHEPKRQGS